MLEFYQYHIYCRELWCRSVKKTQNQTRQGSLLKLVKVNEFSSSIYEPEQVLYNVKNLPSGNTTVFSFYLNCIIAIGILFSFLRFKAPIDYALLDLLVFMACISRKNCYFSLFICHVRQTRENYQRKFKVYSLNL